MITMAGWVLQILIMASSAHDAESSHLILMSDGRSEERRVGKEC